MVFSTVEGEIFIEPETQNLKVITVDAAATHDDDEPKALRLTS